MTQLPPPMNPPLNYGRPQVPQSNGWAVTSLVCGIIGCLLVTPVVAVVTGIIGLGKSRVQGGRGLAIAGIILGSLWIVFGGLAAAGGVYAYKNLATLVTTAAKPQTIKLINRLGGGDLSRDASTGSLTDADLQAIAAKAATLGKCNDITINRTFWKQMNSNVTVEFGGTAVFDKGTAAIDAVMKVDKVSGQNVIAYEKLDLQ